MNGERRHQEVVRRETHQVLISATLIQGFSEQSFSHPNAKISARWLQEAGRLKDYDLVILPFSQFESAPDRYKVVPADPHKNIFDKQVLEALDHGTTFCFVHHDETIPGAITEYTDTGYERGAGVDQCFKMQAGFRWLFLRNIRIGRMDDVILRAEVKRGEFGTFLNKWGASHNYFKVFNDGKCDDVIYVIRGYPIGFSINLSKGMLVYLPFQSNRANETDFTNAVNCLVDSLLTYKAKTVRELPAWAKEPLFEKEIQLAEERARLLNSLKQLESQITPYEEAKSLLVANEHILELAVPNFLSKNLQIPVERDEKYIEDFWLVTEKKERIAICEVKSVAKGFKKGAIYDVFNHREKQGFSETFPAILFVSFNLQAGSWAKKEAPISKDECDIAVKNNVLILRVEDLVRIWDAINNNALLLKDVVKTLTTECGWLECTKNKLIVHK
jgi:hypothetical protein